MKKTLTVNIAGRVFHIDEDAYELLNSYLRDIRNIFKEMEGGNEINEDIEIRISELFNERLSASKQVITIQEVKEVISVLGQPEDIGGKADFESGYYSKQTRRLYRDVDNAIIGGVCSGMATYWNVDPSIVRVVFVVLVLFGMAGILIYLVLWLVLPAADTVSRKLEMRGEPVNLSNIGAFFREEFENVKRSFSNNKEAKV